MDATESSAAHRHHQNSLGAGIRLIILKFRDDPKARSNSLLARMTLLASVRRWNQPIALHRRLDRTRKRFEHDGRELTRAGHLALNPPRCARRDMAGDTSQLAVRRPLMSGKLGLHDVAALTAELHSLHVLDSAIAHLAADDYVR